MILSSTFYILIILFGLRAYPQENIEHFARCVSSYEAKVLDQDSSQARVDRELVQAMRMPTIATLVGPQADLINQISYTRGTDWNLTLTQNLYSRSLSKSIAAHDENIRASKEQEKMMLLQKSIARLDLLFQYVSSLEGLKLIERQMERQRKLTKLLQTITRARITDGSYMLSAQSDLTVLTAKKRETEINIKYIEKVLEELPFFHFKSFQDEQIRNYFTFTANLTPSDASSRSEIIALDRKAKSDFYFLQSEEAQWYPRVDLSVAYSNTSQNSAVGLPVNQLIGGISLSVPLSESFTRKARQGFYRAEISRYEALRDREKYALDNEALFEKNILGEIKNSVNDLSESLNLLLQSREIQIKKFSLNKLSYFELSSLDDRIDQTSKNIISKRIESWHLLSKWYLQKIIQSTEWVETDNCN